MSSRRGARAVAAVLLLLLAACSGGGVTGPATAPAPAPMSPAQQRLESFARKCAKSLDYRPGQVDYPTALQIELGGAKTYGAAIDIREAPVPPGEVIPPDNAASDQVVVQCEVAARLVAVGDGLVIGATEATDGGWRPQRFGPSGVVEWSWSVTADSLPRAQELRLEIRPALRGTDAMTMATAQTAAFVTPVDIKASRIERVGYWFQTDWEILVTTVVALGGALGGLWAWPPGRAVLRKVKRKKSSGADAA